MWMIRCILLVFVVVDWDPVGPGALVEEVGNLTIVNESVRVVPDVRKVTRIRDTLSNIEKGLEMVKDKLLQLETTATHTRLVTRFVVVEDRLMELQLNFF